jgi:hypothetical protein
MRPVQVASVTDIVSFAYVGALEKAIEAHAITDMRTDHCKQCVLATRVGDFFTVHSSNGNAQFDIAGSVDVPLVSCLWADDGDICAVATSLPSLVMLSKDFDVVGECEAG